MAPRRENPQGNNGIDRSAAESVVFDNLDLNPADLGGTGDGVEEGLEDEDEPELGTPNRGQSQLDDDDDDEGDVDPDDPFDPGVIREPGDRSRVSHTRQPQRQPKPLPRRSEVKPDRNGNLIDKDGKIVARAGREARIYQGRERAKRDLSREQTEHNRTREQLRRLAGVARGLHTQVTANKAVSDRLKELGLSSQDQLAAMNMFVELRDNTPQGIRRILARAAAQGVDLTNLTQGGNIGNDPKTMADIVKAEVQKVIDPLRQESEENKRRREEQERENQIQDAARDEVRSFFDRNPEAVPYAPVFNRVLQNPAYRGMSLGEIWAKILQHPNLSDSSQRRQRSRTSLSGMPRGRSFAPQGNSKMFDPTTSYEKIIDHVLNEAGMPRQTRM